MKPNGFKSRDAVRIPSPPLNLRSACSCIPERGGLILIGQVPSPFHYLLCLAQAASSLNTFAMRLLLGEVRKNVFVQRSGWETKLEC